MSETTASPIIYYVAQSLDGFVADRHNSIDWLLDFGFEQFQEHYDAFFSGVGAVIMGSTTFRWLADSGEPWPYPGLPCWVLTRRELPPLEGANVVATDADIASIARAARGAAGERAVWMLGGGVTAAQFVEAGELDELRISIMPITLGSGAGVLPHSSAPQRWELAGTTSFRGGAVEVVYRAVSL